LVVRPSEGLLVERTWSKKKPEPIRPPKVGGTRAPDQILRIDFSKPHDFHFRFDGGRDEVFRGCVLVGFTTPTDDGGNRLGGGGDWLTDRYSESAVFLRSSPTPTADRCTSCFTAMTIRVPGGMSHGFHLDRRLIC